MQTHSGEDNLGNRSSTAKQESNSTEQPDTQHAASLNFSRATASPTTLTAPCAFAQVLGQILKLTLQQSVRNKTREFMCNRG